MPMYFDWYKSLDGICMQLYQAFFLHWLAPEICHLLANAFMSMSLSPGLHLENFPGGP